MQGTPRRSARLQAKSQAQKSMNAKKALATNQTIYQGPQKLDRNRTQKAVAPTQNPEVRSRREQEPNPAEVDKKDTHPERQTPRKDSILHWAQHGAWPNNLADPIMAPMNKLSLIRSNSTTKSTTYLGRTTVQAYARSKCVEYMESRGVFLVNHQDGPLDNDRQSYDELFGKRYDTPKDTMFENNTFAYVCTRLAGRNETAVMQMIHRLIIPSAEIAVHRGHIGFRHLIDSINEPWNGSVSLGGLPVQSSILKPLRFRLPAPQPDYSVGFKEDAFCPEQLRKLRAHIGEVYETSFFKGTSNMLFPFFTVEAKASMGCLEVAHRANAHSTAVAMRGIVELFRMVGRVKDLHRRILAFSISHNYTSALICAHYTVVSEEKEKNKEEKITYHRHPIEDINFQVRNGERRWSTHHFVMALYDNWAPILHKFICSAIDDLPDVDFESLPSAPQGSPVGSSLSAPLEASEGDASPSPQCETPSSSECGSTAASSLSSRLKRASKKRRRR